MKPFKVRLLDALEKGEKVRWRIEVANETKVGSIAAEAPFKDLYTETRGSAYTWKSNAMEVAAAKYLKFRPSLHAAHLGHKPDPYCRGCGGTKGVDEATHNPKLAYDVFVEVLDAQGNLVPSKSYNTRIAMTDKDVIRQEYFTHFHTYQEDVLKSGIKWKKKINCIKGSNASQKAGGLCSGQYARKMPAYSDVVPVVPTTCTSSEVCGPIGRFAKRHIESPLIY